MQCISVWSSSKYFVSIGGKWWRMLCIGGNFLGHALTQCCMEAERMIFFLEKQAKHSNERRMVRKENERVLNPFFHSLHLCFISSSLSFLQRISLSPERAYMCRSRSCGLFSFRFARFVFPGYSSFLFAHCNSNTLFSTFLFCTVNSKFFGFSLLRARWWRLLNIDRK